MSREFTQSKEVMLAVTEPESMSAALPNVRNRTKAGAIALQTVSMKSAFLLAVTFLLALSVYAQLPTATVLGVVKDASGAVVPGTTVTVRNTDTNLTRTAMTQTDGSYRVEALPVGPYELKAEHSGFGPVTQTGIVLVVSQEAVINLTLQVGSTQQVVQVTGDAPLVDTTNSSIGAVVNQQQVSDLPLNGRNYVDLALMQPGTAPDYAFSTTGASGGGTAFSSNGATPWSNFFTLDGAVLNNALAASSSTLAGETLGIDGLEEFKVQSMPDASYGMVMGGQIVMASKAGTNQFHGDVFEYLRNSIFDARNYFDYGYLNGGPRIPHLSRNNFGGAFGGPIKKDKTFFYGNYEGLRQAQGVTVLDTVPAATCHGAAGAVVWNGMGTQPAGSIGPCAQLGANPAGTGTNSVTITQTMAPLLALYPNPNLAKNQFTFPAVNPTSADFGQMRVDQNFSASDTIFARYTITNSALNTWFVQNTNAFAFPQWSQLEPSRNQFLTLAENHIFSTNLLNTARASVSRTTLADVNDYHVSPYIGPQYSFTQGLPMGSIGISGSFPITTLGPLTPKPSVDNLTIYTFSDDVGYSKGRHSLKFGVLFNRFYQAADANGGAQGTLTFTSFASFMRGLPSQYQALSPPAGTTFTNILGPNVVRYYGYDTVGLYAKDDWRLTSKLTLNLGLRYEFETTPIQLCCGPAYALRNGPDDEFVTAHVATPGNLLQDPTYHNFSPRVGFAYDLTGDGRTAIRGAFGIYYDIGNIGSELREALQGTPPFLKSTAVNPYPAQSPGSLVLPLTFTAAELGTSFQTVNYYARAPYSVEYNLSVDRQLPFGMGLTVSYLGLHGVHLWTRGEGNPVNPTSITNGEPFYAASISSCESVVPSCRVDPYWTSSTYDSNAGTSWYNAGSVNLVKQIGHGLQFQTSYTWSKSLDDTEDMGGLETSSGCVTNTSPLNRRIDRGPSCFDTTDRWNLNLVYHLPKVAAGNGFVSKLANGWWMSNIVTAQSGLPYTPVLSTNRSRSGVEGSNGDYANVNTAASIAASGFPGTCTSMPGQPAAGANPCLYTPIPFNKNTVATGNPLNWFNAAMFSLGPVGYLGDAGRDMLRSPGLAEWDFSIDKDTAAHFLGENGSVQFRAEIFNIVNRPNFSIPSGTSFSGSTSDAGPYSELPSATAGQISSTLTTSRQIQFALKLIF